MTQNRRSKRAIRSRMAQTREKYTQARRALLDPDGNSRGTGGDPGAAIAWPDDSLGWFTGQAYNAILLADDEARMLSHPTVGPEHLLLAAARRGRAERLLADAGIDAHAIHDAIVALSGYGSTLELRPRRSAASEEVLRRAVIAAAVRGHHSPSTQHLLIALGEHEPTARILSGLGVTSAQALTDAAYPVAGPPVRQSRLQRRAAELAAGGSTAPSPGPIPPVFERFTARARAALNAGIEYAREVDDHYVEPGHLLFAVLDATAGVAAAVRARYGWHVPPDPSAQPRYPMATGIFSPDARRIVAQDVLVVAERLGHRALTTGHVLIACLERPGGRTSDIISSLPGIAEITAAVIDALPGNEGT
jgi:ATP-dependent Clp protease ATP-binding subunit ClpA